MGKERSASSMPMRERSQWLSLVLLGLILIPTLGLGLSRTDPADSPAPFILTPSPQQISTYGAVLVGCEGIDFSGSARVDSWDSREGLYSEELAGDNTLIVTLDPQIGDITISGASTIHGHLVAARDLKPSNAQYISGNWLAGRNIEITAGNPPCPNGSVYTGGIFSAPSWWINGCGGGADWQEEAIVDLPPNTCDPLDLPAMMNALIAQYAPLGDATPWPHSSSWREDPVLIEESAAYSNFTIGSGNHPVTIDATQVEYLYIDGNLSLAGDGQLHISNPGGLSDIHEVILIVDGNFTTGGSTLLSIDPGVSLRVYATGNISIGGGAAQDIPASIDINGRIEPTFGVYTTASTGALVSVGGAAPLTGVVYAPYANVTVGGSSEVHGAIRGRTINVNGTGQIHYDEGLRLGGSTWDGGPIYGGGADLSIDLSAPDPEIGYNEELTIDVILDATVVDRFEDIEVGITLPPELTYLSHEAPIGSEFIDTNEDGVPDTWLLGDLGPTGISILKIRVSGPLLPDPTQVVVEAEIRDWTGEDDIDPTNNQSSLELGIRPSPVVTITKGTANSEARLDPRTPITYLTTVANNASANAHEVYVYGTIDPELALGLDTYGEGVPFHFVDGTEPSGLTLGTPEFSDDGGESWEYDPASGAGGAPPGFDGQITHWRILMTGEMNPRSSFTIEYEATLISGH